MPGHGRAEEQGLEANVLVLDLYFRTSVQAAAALGACLLSCVWCVCMCVLCVCDVLR